MRKHLIDSPTSHLVGIYCIEGTPVPIPNTEVKLDGAEDTWVVTPRKNREMPISCSSRPIGRLLFFTGKDSVP